MPIEIAIQLILSLIDRAGTISQLIQAAQAKGQTTLSADDWKIITANDDAARAALVAALGSGTQGA